jgi:hypothetical protein
VRMDLFIWLNLMLIVFLPLSQSCCLGDNNKPSVAVGTHLKLINMGPYIVELNQTDDSEYYIGNVTTGKGNIKTGPPDCFTYSNYTQYQRDILDKKGGERKFSLDMGQYDVIEPTNENLLEHGLSKWPWDESNPYESHFIGDRKWIIIKGTQENEIDAACWIDDNTMLSLRMFNINESDSMAILGSVTFRPS